MKKAIYLLGTALMLFIGFTSCSSDDDNTPPVIVDPDPDPEVQVIQKIGLITANETWTKDNIYVLNGKVVVDEGVTLTIDAGTLIKGAQGQGSLASALIVDQGGKIEANGTAADPIIMTSILDNIAPGELVSPNLTINDTGLWGGLIILGRAPISVSGDVETAQIEGIPASDSFGQYGGTNPSDNSGIFRYISLRHGGIAIAPDNEINGITMGGVGNSTIMENLEVISNQDDAFEWFGGTVNGSNFITWGHQDDGFDADQSWSGTLDNGIVIQTALSDRALELDGPEGSVATEAGYTMRNITLIGNPSTGQFMTDARDGLIANLENVLVYNFGPDSRVRVNGADSRTELANDRLVFSNWEVVLAAGVTIDDLIVGDLQEGDELKFTTNATAIPNVGAATVGADVSVFAWTYSVAQNAF